VRIDERQLEGLIEESQDLQSDAIAGAKASIPDLQEIAMERRNEQPDPSLVQELIATRRGLLRKWGVGGGSLATRGLLGGGFGAALAAIVAGPVSAQTNVDVQMLQTASSLEKLAVGTYAAALGLDFIKNGNKVVVKFAQTTMAQHDEHRKAFQAQTKALGAPVQDAPNPKYKTVVDQAVPTLKGPLDVVKLAATLERVATDTYLADLALFNDKRSKEIMGSVMGVESQHFATLRAVQALIEGNAPELIAIPTDLPKLPAAAGSVAFPEAFEKTGPAGIAEPESGAIK